MRRRVDQWTFVFACSPRYHTDFRLFCLDSEQYSHHRCIMRNLPFPLSPFASVILKATYTVAASVPDGDWNLLTILCLHCEFLLFVEPSVLGKGSFSKRLILIAEFAAVTSRWWPSSIYIVPPSISHISLMRGDGLLILMRYVCLSSYVEPHSVCYYNGINLIEDRYWDGA